MEKEEKHRFKTKREKKKSWKIGRKKEENYYDCEDDDGWAEDKGGEEME